MADIVTFSGIDLGKLGTQAFGGLLDLGKLYISEEIVSHGSGGPDVPYFGVPSPAPNPSPAPQQSQAAPPPTTTQSGAPAQPPSSGGGASAFKIVAIAAVGTFAAIGAALGIWKLAA